MPFYNWFTTPASNATSDSTCPFPEGMSPSAVNDGVRALMARLREWGNDSSGSVVTAGTSTAYTLATNQGFDTLAHLSGQEVGFTPHVACGATVTLNVDLLGAKPLRTAPGVELIAGQLTQGTPYVAVYNSSDAAFYLQGFVPVVNAAAVSTVSLADKAVTLQKLYHPSATSRLLGSDSVAAQNITGAMNNGSGATRLIVASTTGYSTGQSKTVSDVVGTKEANGTWTITVVDSTHIDLQGSTFTNAYTSGGTIGGGVEEITIGTGLNLTANVLAAFNAPPQGYLTLTSGTPIISGDVTGAANIYYTPYTGNFVPLYNGTGFAPTAFAELNLSLTSSQLANTIYDVFVFLNSGVVTIGVGPAWASSVAGSGARGTGAGTTELTRLNGIWVNNVAMTASNSTNSYSVPANQGTYVGSVYIDGTSGRISCYRTWGQSRKWGVWNAYNRAPVILKAGDSTATWTYIVSTIRPSNNNTANSLTVFSGLAEEMYDTSFTQYLTASNGTSYHSTNGIGFNSTSAYSGKSGNVGMVNVTGTLFGDGYAKYTAPPSLGISTITCLEAGLVSNSGPIFNGTEANMVLAAAWRA